MAAVGEKYGPYTCVRRLGEGGMAETFLALQSGPYGFQQRVCIKIIREDCKALPKFVEAFVAEATIAASLRHSNIVSVIDASQQHGYMVLELVDGVDLHTLSQALPTGRLAPDLVSYLALELVKALEFAHHRRLHGKIDGIVHRDIKPSNVLVSYAGEVKLADFGIAKAIRSTGNSDGLIRGTPSYMSPEQAEGKPLDARSDLFSLGILLYEMLVGRRPFDGNDDLDTVRKICQSEFQPLALVAPDVPAGLAVVIEKLLSSSPESRLSSARELGSALDRFAPPPSTYRRLGALAREARPPETLVISADENTPPLSLPVSELSSPSEPQTGSREHTFVEPPSGRSVSSSPAPSARLPETVSLMADANADNSLLPPAATASTPFPFQGEGWTKAGRSGLSGRGRSALVTAAAASVAVASLLLSVFAFKGGSRSLTSTPVESLVSGPDASPLVGPEPTPTAPGLPSIEFKPASTARGSPSIEYRPASTAPGSRSIEFKRASTARGSPSIEFKPVSTDPTEITGDPSIEGSAVVNPTVGTPTADTSFGSGKAPSPIRETSRTAARNGRRSAPNKAPAHITVGVFPWGSVWIDGAAKGKAPISADLPPGRHTVAGGTKAPDVSRNVWLRSGITTQVVINVTAKTFNAIHKPNVR